MKLRFSTHSSLTATGLGQSSSIWTRFLHRKKNSFDYCSTSIVIRPRSHCFGSFVGIQFYLQGDRRYFSVYQEANAQSLVVGRTRTLPAWHDANFMKNSSMEEKESWLEDQINRATKRCDMSMLDVEAFNFVLKSWAREATFNKAAAFHAEQWLLRLRHENHRSESWWNEEQQQPKQYSDTKLHGPIFHIQPNAESYNAVLEAWSKSSDLVAVIRSERWLSELCKATNALPLEECGIGDEQWMQRHKDTNMSEGPTTESYNYYLATLSRGIGKTGQDIEANAIKAEQTLRRMMAHWEKFHDIRQAPNTDSFNYVMNAITKCESDPTIADRVMEWIQLMESLQRAMEVTDATCNTDTIIDVRPNTKSYTIVINAWGILARQKAEASVKSLRRQRTMQSMQVKKGRHNSTAKPQASSASDTTTNAGVEEVQKAKSILDYMHALHRAGSTEVIPNSISYNSVISAWSKISSEYNEGAPLRAEELLREMLQLHEDRIYPELNPDHFSYTNIIHAWTRLKSIESSKRAEWWLRAMWRDVNDESLDVEDRQKRMPNTFTYNTIIKSWCDLREAKRADSLLRELICIELEGKYPLSVNTDTLALVISAWVKHELRKNNIQPGVGLEAAFQLLHDLTKREEEGRHDICSSIDVFNNVLKAASESPLCSIRVYNIAMKTFHLLDSSRHTPNHFSYEYLLKTGIKVLSIQNDKSKVNNFVKMAAMRCCDNGQLSRGVLQVISRFASLLQETMEWPPPKSSSRNITNPFWLPLHHNAANSD